MKDKVNLLLVEVMSGNIFDFKDISNNYLYCPLTFVFLYVKVGFEKERI